MDTQIEDLQRRLANEGLYYGKIDGIDGPRTQFAVANRTSTIDDEQYIFSGITWNPTNNYDFKLRKPILIVIHYTACPAYMAIAGFKRQKESGNRSAHYVIDEKGSVTQMVTDTHRAWHAGKSSWNKLNDCNSFSIGIELENFGPISLLKNKLYTHAGDAFNGPVEDINGKLWHSYDWVQLEACAALTAALKLRHGITEVVGHEHISPIRKIDPGPAFPWEYFNKLTSEYEDKLKEVKFCC